MDWIQERLVGRFSANLTANNCTVGGFNANMGGERRQSRRLHCAYLEVVIRLSAVIFPRIASC